MSTPKRREHCIGNIYIFFFAAKIRCMPGGEIVIVFHKNGDMVKMKTELYEAKIAFASSPGNDSNGKCASNFVLNNQFRVLLIISFIH